MGFLDRVFQAGRRLDQTVYRKLGIDKAVAAIRPKLPPSLMRFGARYGPVVAIVTLVALYAAALSGTTGVTTTDDPTDQEALERFTGLPGEDLLESPSPGSPEEAAQQAQRAASAATAKEIAKQFVAPPSANVCGKNNVLQTGSTVQFPWAVQCLPKFSGDNGGETYRGVYRDKIRMAWYYSNDPVIVGATKAAQGCGSFECSQDYMQTYVDWFMKYYETYGRKIELVPVQSSGRDDDPTAAQSDASKIIDIKPPVFGVLNGPGQAAPSYVARLKEAGLMCFGCGVSLPQEFSEQMAPFAWGTLQSSTLAYIHRAEYVGKRLAPHPANHAAGLLKDKPRTFALVYFDNTNRDYQSGVDFFEQELKEKYGVTLKEKIRYVNIEGCNINAGAMVAALKAADNGQGVTSVIFSGDPICPIELTHQAQVQSAQWEWIITGSVLTDSNNFGRLYQQDQWSRAFGVSMLAPDVKNENDYWFKMYREMKPSGTPLEEAPVVLGPPIIFFTGVHLAGEKLTPETFAAGMAKAIPTGGTVTIGRRSYGPKKLGGRTFLDYTSFDDMTEIWWDRNARDPNNRQGAYWYVDGGARYAWYGWPDSKPRAFDKAGATVGYEKAPDQ